MVYTRSILVSIVMVLALVFGVSSLAFADESLEGEVASEVAADTQITAQASSFTVVDFNDHDVQNTTISIGERMNVRVKNASSTKVSWTSSDTSVIKIQKGAAAGLANDGECTLISVGGIGWSTITATCGNESFTFRILVRQVDLTSGYYWTAPANCTYNGTALKPPVGIAGARYTVVNGSVQQSEGQLVEGVDYTVAYSNNTNVGTATAVVTGIGLYRGSRTFTFKINPAQSTSSTGSSSSSSSSGTSQAGIAGSAGATVVVPQAPPASTTVGGTWKKSKGLWWFEYDAATAKAQGKKWPAGEWVTIKGKRYHFNSSGYMNSGWYQSANTWFYLGSDGAMKTGWQKVKGKWYYLASDGIMQTGKKLIDNIIYFLTSSGAMKTGWNKESAGWYYYTSSGAMKTGWQKDKGAWYYLNPSNGVMKTGFYDVGSTRYYSNSSGKMLTGWQKISGKWYYFNGSGAMQKGKWIGNYYVGADGVMATSQWIGEYYVDANGKWVKGAKR